MENNKMTKLPSVEKVYEAWSAVTDGRVQIEADSNLDAGRAVVKSSDGSKEYTITWRDGGSVFTSSDPATYWQGYAGYQVIAVLIELKRLPLPDCARLFKGVNWTALNNSYKRDYAAALLSVERERNIDPETPTREADNCLADLAALGITLRRK